MVSTTGASQPIVTLERYRAIEPRRFQRPLFILDLAMPRDFDPAIGDCLGVYLYSIDDLQPPASAIAAQRDKELPARWQSSKKKRSASWPTCTTAPPAPSSSGCATAGTRPR